jgi:hypothetical protein
MHLLVFYSAGNSCFTIIRTYVTYTRMYTLLYLPHNSVYHLEKHEVSNNYLPYVCVIRSQYMAFTVWHSFTVSEGKWHLQPKQLLVKYELRLQPCHTQLTYARNIPNAVCLAPPENEQVKLETCKGPSFSLNWMKGASRWFHYTDML